MNLTYPQILRFTQDIVSPAICERHIKKYYTAKTRVTSYIYFITDGEFVKIGSAQKPLKRMKDLQIANARELKLLFTIPVHQMWGCHSDYRTDIESYLHKGFGKYHIRGEWFDILTHIDVQDWKDTFGCSTEEG